MTSPTLDPFKARYEREFRRCWWHHSRDLITTGLVTLLMGIWVVGLVGFGVLLGKMF